MASGSMATMGEMQPTDYLLDNFVAHKLSTLTECGAPELPIASTWLNGFILNSVFTTKWEPSRRAYAFNFIRRAEGAIATYREARLALIEYLNSGRGSVSPYFRSLMYFEICAAKCIEGYELIRSATGDKYFQTGDGTPLERLYAVYSDAKHMEQVIKQGRVPTEATAAVWITNSGLEAARTPGLTFVELTEILTDMGEAAEKLARATA
jgi:hypothetical protein